MNCLDGIKELVSRAADRNMVVYDSIAKPGLLTDALRTLLNETSIENDTGPITRLYAALNTLKEYKPDSSVKHIQEEVYPDDVWGEIENYYLNTLQGCYAAGDSNLVIAVSENGTPLLGSF